MPVLVFSHVEKHNVKKCWAQNRPLWNSIGDNFWDWYIVVTIAGIFLFSWKLYKLQMFSFNSNFHVLWYKWWGRDSFKSRVKVHYDYSGNLLIAEAIVSSIICNSASPKLKLKCILTKMHSVGLIFLSPVSIRVYCLLFFQTVFLNKK